MEIVNKLIQELAEQASHQSPEGYAVTIPYSKDFAKKFAELIIEECAKVSDRAEKQCQHPATEIKQHFGIEQFKPIPDGIDLNDPSWRKILGLDRRVLTPAESAAFISKITGKDLAPLYSTNNQRSITEVYEIDGVKFHVNYLDEGEMIVEEML
jgi:hypothetical protein